MFKLPRIILFLLLLILFFHLYHFYAEMPEKVASHFNGAGDPNSWTSKNSFVFLTAAIGLSAACFSVFIMFLIENIPVSLLNLPNKNYWLAEERRAESLSRIRTFFEWFSVGMLVLINVVFYFTLKANAHKEPLSSAIWFVIIGFFAFVIIWIIVFARRFRIPNSI